MSTVMLFASELAATIGRNPFVSVTAAKQKVWSRTDPVSYAAAQARTSTPVTTQTERFVALPVDLTTVVQAASAATMQSELTRVLAQPVNNNQKPNTAVIEAVAARDTAEIAKLCTPADASPAAAARTAEIAQRVVDGTAPVSAVLQSVKFEDCTTTRKDIQSSVFTQRGARSETAATDAYSSLKRQKVSGRNDAFYRKALGSGVALGGRIDGLTEDRLVEIKCRQRRFFDTLPSYERVQLYAYMFLTDVHTCDLVQQLNGETRISTYEFEPDVWAEYTAEALQFADDFKALLASEQQQDALILALHGTG